MFALNRSKWIKASGIQTDFASDRHAQGIRVGCSTGEEESLKRQTALVGMIVDQITKLTNHLTTRFFKHALDVSRYKTVSDITGFERFGLSIGKSELALEGISKLSRALL